MAPKKNAFYFFMLEIQRREQEKGVKCSLVAAQKLADPLWKDMNAQQKKKYLDLAEKYNNGERHDPSRKFTSQGKSFAQLEREERTTRENLSIMSQTVASTVQELANKDKLRTHNFFVCHVNYYYRKDDYYAPAEVAIVVFNFEKGIIDKLHFFVHIGTVPLGYKATAKEWTDGCHQIPFWDSKWANAETEEDDYQIYCKVTNLVKTHCPGGVAPPIYTMTDSLNHNFSHTAVECFFNNICDAARVDPGLFRVYYLDYLFYEINRVIRPNDTITQALMRSEIEKDSFSYAQRVACKFHEDIDQSINCSLAKATRWVFTICDHTCKHLGVKLRAGVHVPQEVDVCWSARAAPSFSQPSAVVSGLTADLANVKFEDPEDDGRSSVSHRPSQRSADVRMPKRSYSDKIMAKFPEAPGSDASSSLTFASPDSSEVSGDDDWHPVKSKGKGRPLATGSSSQPPNLPVSGRGRLLARNLNTQ